MNISLLSEVAGKISHADFSESWGYYLVFIALIALSMYFGGRLKAYAAEKGKFHAIEENFIKVMIQLEKTTSATKSIELTLSHNDWTSREYKTLRRGKLENLMFGIYETRDWVGKHVMADYSNEDFEIVSSPIQKVVVIAALYFPELKGINERFFSVHQKFVITVLSEIMPLKETQSEIKLTEMAIDGVRKIESDEFTKLVSELIERLGKAHERNLEVRKAFQKILMPLYRDLQEVLIEYCENIEKMMQTTIVPDDSVGVTLRSS